MKLEIFNTLHETFGFAWRNFDTTARLAWFPLFLIFIVSVFLVYFYLSVGTGGLVTIFDTPYLEAVQSLPGVVTSLAGTNPGAIFLIESGRYIFLTMMMAIVLVALFRFAARGIAPPLSSFNVAFGRRHLVFIGVVALTGFGVLFLTSNAMNISQGVFEQFILYTESNPVSATFPNPESLHTIELQTHTWIFGSLNTIFLYGIGLAVLYFSIRLAALPAFVAAREPGDSYNSFDMSFAVSKGWNSFRLAVLLLIISAIAVGLYFVMFFGLSTMIFSALYSIIGFLESINGLRSASADDVGPENLIFLLSVIIVQFMLIIYMIIVFGMYAGLGGSLFRHGERIASNN